MSYITRRRIGYPSTAQKGANSLLGFTKLFFFCALSTEFIYIQFAGGVLRPYHFLIPPLLLLMLPRAGQIFPSGTAFGLALFLASTLLGVVASDSMANAFQSSILLLLNSSIAILFAIFLTSRPLSTRFFQEAIVRIAFLTICVAAVQFIAMRVGGTAIGFSPQQVSQINAGFAPSLFNEANGYAKFLITPSLFLVPFFVREVSGNREKFLGILIVFAFLINFMRSALFAIALTAMFMFLWYYFKGVISKSLGRVVFAGFTLAGTVYVFVAFGVISSEYSLYKFQTLFDFSNLGEDESWAFRSMSMSAAIDQTTSSPWRIAFGNGWGQVYEFFRGEERQVGGADFVNVFAYNGVIGVAAYGFMLIQALLSAGRRASQAMYFKDRLLAEGVMFAIVGNIALGMVSGMLLWPSFWLLIGLAIAMDVESFKEQSLRRYVRRKV